MKNSSNQQIFRGSTLCKSNFQQPPKQDYPLII